ncbi:thiamine pyrophosphate-dependent dehydrogenase E1 component subunit alpha [Terricaulis silvestris]|uniref:Acetoin:2,6-dichlorophenolindophenol oxidoreductase subunit alpha n=1 Tax=Terricaulis silvestris TaxID=2686094 RepID=A0A6I6MKS9_9CAUL|nr:thiamine pyrophosphate-dependent dehydrogenase E1 component subunit alpha [Terricaulis silvestris]QGZ93766.1 Acetoin:2,6-dichlorophenolindophenol oxidoreductase subunit alpha [Terricaulis silvestris]
MSVTKAAEKKASSNRRSAELLDLYERMVLIREAERMCGVLFAEGEIPGFIHLSDGQEAVSVGVMASMTAEDTISSTHRGHGHALAKGLALDSFFKELMGKVDGACKGRGGSMHVADLSVGMLGANGIVGGGVAIAVGSGLAHKLRGGDAIAASFFGDGALAEGVFHESLNIASLMQIPVLFACENNGWSEFSPTSTQIVFSLEDLAAAHKIDYRRVDGSDLEEVSAVASEIIDAMRRDRRPRVLECITVRARGHFEGDAQRYRGAGPAPVDPLAKTRLLLEEAGASAGDLDQLSERARTQVAAAIEAARRSDEPTLQSAAEEVYAQGVKP